jgi:hypothetical protein
VTDAHVCANCHANLWDTELDPEPVQQSAA